MRSSYRGHSFAVRCDKPDDVSTIPMAVQHVRVAAPDCGSNPSQVPQILATGRLYHVHRNPRIPEPLEKGAGAAVGECNDCGLDAQLTQPGRQGEHGAFCAPDRAGSDDVQRGKRHDQTGFIRLRIRKIRANPAPGYRDSSTRRDIPS